MTDRAKKIQLRIEGLRKFLAAHVPLADYADVCARVEDEITAITSMDRCRHCRMCWREAHPYGPMPAEIRKWPLTCGGAPPKTFTSRKCEAREEGTGIQCCATGAHVVHWAPMGQRYIGWNADGVSIGPYRAYVVDKLMEKIR